MSYTSFTVNNTHRFLVTQNIVDKLDESFENLIMVFKMTDYRVTFYKVGTRVVQVMFSKNGLTNGNEDFSLSFVKNSEQKLSELNVTFKKEKLDKVLNLFLTDMDVCVDEVSNKVNVRTFIPNGMVKIMDKLKYV